ncbi:MAG: hypothetical protein QXU69_10880 [Thermofilaceae archaeon]
MNIEELILRAVEAEAKLKPNEKVFIGAREYTYAEFAKLLKKNDRSSKKLVEDFLSIAVKLFKENDDFKKRVLSLAGAT